MLPSYFHEIGKIPLLTAEEEVELSLRVQAGCEEARNRMIAANLRLVVRIAGEFSRCGLPVDDVISEGNLGLIKSVQRFRPHKGSRFSSYASWWIRQSILRALGEQTNAITLRPAVTSKLSKLRRVAQGMAEEMGREPTDEELAAELGLQTASVQDLKSAGARPASMDAEISSGGGATLGSLLVDESAADPMEALSGKDLAVEVLALLGALKPREWAVIVRRFGLHGHQKATLEEIGADLGITRERVRQIQEESLKRMRRLFLRRQAQPPLGEVVSGPHWHGSAMQMFPAQAAA
jgi:RNA polymerase primary sigma factor